MGKGFCAHRVVERDSQDRIIADRVCEDFAEAEPLWREGCAGLPEGHSLALQHGARVIRWWPEAG